VAIVLLRCGDARLKECIPHREFSTAQLIEAPVCLYVAEESSSVSLRHSDRASSEAVDLARCGVPRWSNIPPLATLSMACKEDTQQDGGDKAASCSQKHREKRFRNSG
jgi:hypothetical protein